MRNFWLFAIAATLGACGAPGAEKTASDAAPAPAPPVVETPATIEQPAPAPFDTSGTKAGEYKVDPGHGYIVFSYDHMGYSRPILRWGKWTADLNWDPAAPANSSVNATIDVASVDTGVAKLDEHLTSADFFDAATFPEITFRSTAVELTGSDAGRITGDLTVRDVTKPVTLDVKINRAANDDFAKSYKLGFSGSTTIKRSEFGVDKYVPVVGDDVSVTIEAEFVMPREAEAQ